MSENVRTRAAALTTVLNILLTVLKFALYGLSGSLAVLAEAWHSFSDIGTSLMVYFAVRRSGHSRDCGPAVARTELLIALGIGIVLTCVGLGLLAKFFPAGRPVVQKPLVSGITFLVFSLGSYFIYRFETRIGEREGSIGLVADGMHARADMTASLLTGFSLVLYAMGIDVDRWVAGVIALCILTFALETIVNVALAYRRGSENDLFTYRSFRIVSFLGDWDKLRALSAAVAVFLSGSLGGTPAVRRVCRMTMFLPVLVLAGLYAGTCLYSVGTREQAIVERFGRPLACGAVPPGMHLKLPWLIDRVRRVEVTRIRQLNIGNVADGQARALLWTQRHGTEEAFISGDNNFFYPYIVLHYRISDVHDYLYRAADPESLLTDTAHHIATRIFATTAFYTLAATSRREIERDFFTRLQAGIEPLQLGIEVLSVNFRDIHPPMSVADSFERVIAGLQEKQQTINEALKYCNTVLPAGRADAARIVEGAGGYICRRTKQARGEADRFMRTLPPTAQAKQIVRTRVYLQTVKETLRETANVIIDRKAAAPEIWSGFEALLPKPAQGERSQ